MPGAPVGITRLVNPAPLYAPSMASFPHLRTWQRAAAIRAHVSDLATATHCPDAYATKERSMAMRQPHPLRPRLRDFPAASNDLSPLVMPVGFLRNRAARFLPEPHGAFRRPASPDVHPVARLPLARQTFGRGVSTAYPCAVPEKPHQAAFVTATREPLVEDRVSPRPARATVPHLADPHACFLSAIAVAPVQDRIPSRFCGDGFRRSLCLLGTARPYSPGIMPCRV